MSDALLDAAETAVPIETASESDLAVALERLGGQAAGLILLRRHVASRPAEPLLASAPATRPGGAGVIT